MTIFIALSGGVDSAVAAYLLKEKNHPLIGISHIVWPESKCCESVCLDHCAQFCQQLGIPYYRIDCIVSFCKHVINPFVDFYHHGKTPNPCVLCNECIRFDVMLKKIAEQHPELCSEDNQIATGHYARVCYENNQYVLKKAKDVTKDQSYMLYRLSQEQLKKCVFPLGELYKTEVRNLAKNWHLKAAEKKDSQDACFVSTTYQDFLDSYSGKKFPKGNLIDKDGHILGQHKGIAYYTRGQRKGLQLSGGPWYVIQINTDDQTILLGSKSDLLTKTFKIEDCHWIIQKLDKKFRCKVQTRYHAKEINCEVERLSDNKAKIQLEEPSPDVTPGQSAVLYQDDRVVGGGVIQDENT